METDFMSYQSKLLDPRWQQTRLKVFERDGWKCRICKSSEKSLHAHHIYYKKDSDGPWDYDFEALITLCNECHETEHFCLEQAKVNLFNSLAKAGFCTSEDFLCLADMIDMGMYGQKN
jgi:5-methylcytosine-specific restriction endonuclease McrA